MFMHGFFHVKDKKLLVFKNEFHHAFSSKNCAGWAICKLHLAVLVVICKSQLSVRKKALKMPHIKNADEIDPRAQLMSRSALPTNIRLG
jgi:hypothetical protein